MAESSQPFSSSIYSNRQYVPEESYGRLSLYRMALSKPELDNPTKLGCLAKSAALLDGLPIVREFDQKSKNSARKFKLQKPVKTPEIWQILFDRATAYRDIASTYRLMGDAQNASFNADRATLLLETLVYTTEECTDRVFAINTLLQVITDWITIEQSLAHLGKAAKLEQRKLKWRSQLSF
ncbi:hypothetical protein GGI12_002011 [Dipsacomyces acuminosporus]|nr:hypothetical protein GGI12_002011 [Dipsacomyces acuminosporus]